MRRAPRLRAARRVLLPSWLRSLTSADHLSQSMDNVAWSSGLQGLTLEKQLNQSMGNITSPSGLQSLTFGHPLSRAWTM